MRLHRGGVVLLTGLVLAACSGNKNVREPAELKDITDPVRLQTLWSASAGAGSGDYHGNFSLALAPDALFAADVKGNVFAFDPGNGRRIWRSETGTRLISGPTVSGASVFAGSMDGELIALKRSDGSEAWRTTLSSEVLAPPVSDGTVVVARAGDGRTYGLSAASGSRIWTHSTLVPSLTLRGLSAPLVQGGRAFIGFDNGRIAALRLSDGQLAWEQVVAAATGRNELERIIDVDAALFGDGPEVFAVSYGGEVVSFDGETGQPMWRRPIRSYSGLTRAGDNIVVTDEAGMVWALDARTGAAAWKNEDLQYRRLSAPAAFQQYVVVGDFEGYVHWLDASNGRVVARTRAGRDPIQTAPQVTEERVYILNTQGRITALAPR